MVDRQNRSWTSALKDIAKSSVMVHFPSLMQGIQRILLSVWILGRNRQLIDVEGLANPYIKH
jgi:hypothetical protein